MKILLLVHLFFIICNAKKCSKNEWKCYKSGDCILLDNVCDYNKLDCKYGEDENYKFCLKWDQSHNASETSTTSLASETSTTSLESETITTSLASETSTTSLASETTIVSNSTNPFLYSTSLTSTYIIQYDSPLKNNSLFIKGKNYIYIIIILIQVIIIIILFLKLKKKQEIYISNVYLEPTKLNEKYETIPEYETVL